MAALWNEIVERFEKNNKRIGAKLALAFITWRARHESQPKLPTFSIKA